MSVNPPEARNTSSKELLLVVMHSSQDEALAEAISDLLKSALGLVSGQIRRHSEGHWPAGTKSQAAFPEELKASKLVVGLITPRSLASSSLMFDLGARWGAGLPVTLLLAEVRPDDLAGALHFVDTQIIVDETSLQQFIESVSKPLALRLQNPQLYSHHRAWVRQLAGELLNEVQPTMAKPAASESAIPQAGLYLSVERTPPEQVIEVKATIPIKVFRVEYMLTNEMCIVGENVELEGDILSVPLKHALIMKMWNTRRFDMNPNDRSGPAKIAVTISANGKLRQCVLPVQMEHGLIDSTVFPKLTGSKNFEGG